MPTITLTPEEERDNLERSVALANDYRTTVGTVCVMPWAAKTRVLSAGTCSVPPHAARPSGLVAQRHA